MRHKLVQAIVKAYESASTAPATRRGADARGLSARHGGARARAAGASRTSRCLAPDGSRRRRRAGLRGLAGASARRARARGEVTVALVSDGRMRALNRTFRGKDYATDVLSFPVAARRRRAGPPSALRPRRYLGES